MEILARGTQPVVWLRGHRKGARALRRAMRAVATPARPLPPVTHLYFSWPWTLCKGGVAAGMRAATRILILFLAAGAWWLGFWTATTQSSPASAGDLRADGGEAQAAPGGSDPAESGAVCPVVYQLDQSPSSREYHYQFFGNAFFINERGYLLTDEHVLETFRDGGQPYILVNRRESPPQLLAANIVAVDKAHDVAILRAETNPFGRPFRVAFLTLSAEPAVAGETV